MLYLSLYGVVYQIVPACSKSFTRQCTGHKVREQRATTVQLCASFNALNTKNTVTIPSNDIVSFDLGEDLRGKVCKILIFSFLRNLF